MYSSSAASIMTLFAWVTAVGGGLFAAIYGDIGYHAYAQSGGLENMPLPNASVVAAVDPVAGILVAVLLFTLVNVLVAVICAHQHNERVAANVTLAIELSTK